MPRPTKYNIFVALIMATGSFGYGFGFGVFVASIGQPGFYKDMRLDPTSSYTANILGAVNALFAAGAAFGCLAQGWLADWIGRKKSLYIAASCTLIGAALTSASPVIAMLVTVRILHGFGLGMIQCLVPMYMTEVSPAHCRGAMTGMTAGGSGLGYILVAWVSVGSFYAKNQTLQWRMPLALACVGPLLLLCGLPFVPESPRYLCWVGRDEAALATIQRLHSDPGRDTHFGAQAEFVQIQAQVAKDKELKTGYIQLFKNPSWRRRALLVMFIMMASQSTGVYGITNYIVIIFSTLGLSGSVPLIVYSFYSLAGTLGVIGVALIMDRYGRRRLFLIGFPLIALVLLIEAVLQTQYLGTDNKIGNGTAVGIIYLFVVVYQLVDIPSFVWCAEIFPTTIRAKGMGLAMFAWFVGFITFATPGPQMFRTIKWKSYLIYMACCIVSEVLTYFFIPETKGKPIEEIGALFGDEVAVHITADGEGVVEKPDVHVEQREVSA